MLILLLFFSSGATALVYEVLWSKYLTMMLGSTVQAQTVVLAVFMGGLAIGNRIFGKRSISVNNPLLVYGVLEIIIGAYAFAFPWIYRAADWTFVTVGSQFPGASFLLLLLKLVISVVLLLLPTIMMGGTLPVIAAWIQKQPQFESGARVGIFYAVNSLGAVFGAGLAGFYLVKTFGMVFSLELTAVANFVIGLLAAIISKIHQTRIPAPSSATTPAPVESAAPAPASGTWFALLVALTGGVSMGLEVLSARTLALVAGGSLQAFALVLMSFIFGIGLGSIAISSSQAARRYGLNTIYFLLLMAGALVIVNVVFIEKWTIIYSHARFGLAPNVTGYVWHQIALALMSFIILGLPAACLGAVVPLSIRFLGGQSKSLGDQVGRLLTANTIGAVVGVFLTGFVLMPFIGLRGALATLAVILMGVTAFIAFKREQPSAAYVALALIALSIVSVTTTGEGWRVVMGSGVYRIRNSHISQDWLDTRQKYTELLFYKDSADATVAVEKSQFPHESAAQINLRTNGKTEASTIGDLSTQYLVAHLPLMANPDAKNVFVLGFGSGITAGAVLGHPVEKIVVAENCAPILEAGHIFNKWNRGVLTNERVIIRNDDARAVLKLNPIKYDVIINEPSNPWVAGVGSIFSKEFYELCASRLNDGGIVAQWFHNYEMSDYVVFLVLRTFSQTFPHMEIWDTQEGDIVMLGAKQPWPSNPAQYQKIFARPQVRADMSEIHINSAVALWTRQLASQKTAFAIPGDGPIQQDEFPILEYEAPKAFFIGQEANSLQFYDERTVQFTLADRGKIAALRALPENVVLDVFKYYRSSNRDIMLYHNALLNKGTGGLQRLDPTGHIVFRPALGYPEEPPGASNATPEFAICLRQEARMLRDMANWREPAALIEKTLHDMLARDLLDPKDFTPSYFAALAGRFAIAEGDWNTALRVLRLGLAFNSSDEQILYLTRVLDHIIPPEMLEEFKKKDPLQLSNDP